MKATYNLILLLLFGCMIGGPTPPPAFDIQIFYKGQNGEDLLNPATPSHLNKDLIYVTDLVTKNAVTAQKPAQMITPIDPCDKYVCQSSKTNLYYIQFCPNPAYEGTLVHFGSSSTDTLTYTKIPMNSGYGIDKVLYKGQTLWSSAPNFTTSVSVTIVK